MSSYIPHPASAPSQPFAQTNPFEFAREHTIRDDWALRLDPETDTPDRLRAGAFAIMSEGFGIKDPTGRVFSGAQQNALDPKEYFAKARACWDAGSLAPVQSEGWNEYHDAAEKGDRATMRRLARENIRGEDAGNDVAAAWDPAMSRIGLKDDLDMERELLSVRDVLTPEEIAIIEESGRARAEKTAQTEFASDTFDEDFYENASAFDFMFARNKDLRDEETKARHAEANSRLAEVYRRHADDIRDEQRLPAYERQLADENLWATVQGLRGAVSDDAWRVVEMAQTLAGPKTDKRVLDAFEKLTTTEQRSIAGVLHALHYGRDTTLVGDAFRSFWDTAAQTVGGSARAIADVFRRGVMDGEEYRDMVERRALLEQANSGRMKEWGYLGQSVVGAFSTIPYMAVAAIPYAGTAAIMASASDQFQTEAALNGVDVGSREFMLTNWAFSGAYAAVEKLQIVPFKPLKNVSRRQMYCEMFHSLRSALFVAGGVAGTTVSESVEEGIQGGIERVVEGWGLGHDQAKEFAAGFASDFVGSLGTMAIIGAVGAGVQHHRYRSGAFSPEEAISATARVADLESRIKGHPEDAAVPLGEFSREFGMLGKDWVNAGTDGTARVRALMRWGFTPEQATRIHGMFSEIWKGVSGDEDARSEFVGGNRVRSAAELLADTLGVQVEDGENGEKSVSFRIGRGRVKLRFNPADRIETAVDVNDRTQAADVVEILNRNEETATGTRGTMTVDEWLALPEEVRREQTKGMTVQGGFKIDAPDGTSVGEDALRVLSGRVIETDVALPQTVFHESMHAVLRLLREEAATDPEARALQEELAKVYAPQAGIDEAVNEEALADGYQTYLTSLTTAVEDTGVFARLKRWIAQLLGRATVARDSLRAAQSAQGRLFNLALTGDITPAMRKEEAKPEGPSSGEQGTKPVENQTTEAEKPSQAEPAAPSPAQQKLSDLEAQLAATPREEIAKRQRLENRIAEQRRKVEREGAGTRASISGIYTGSAADYAERVPVLDKDGNVTGYRIDNAPSLRHVGSGEGSQVYGWGLYASDQRGVAESYGKVGKDDRNIYKDGRLLGNGDFESPGEWLINMNRVKPNPVESAKNAAREEIKNGDDDFYVRALKEIEGSEWRVEPKHSNLYEQTFFTDRAPGDERHLLKWYEPVSEEQVGWIADAWFKENPTQAPTSAPTFRLYAIRDRDGSFPTGEGVYNIFSTALGSEQAASEFLARAGIDGVKYPVDSWGGKGVKDGDKAGWNYVSFRDDNIRVDHKWVDGVQRYSITPAEDAAYMDAVSRGDMETAQRMVREAAARAMPNTKVVDEDGLPKVVYHDSGERHNILSREYARKSMDIEAVFFHENRDEFHEYGSVEHAVFLNIRNPANFAQATDGFDPGSTDDAGVRQREKLQSEGYDGFWFSSEEMGGPDLAELGVFDSSQIKSADPATYDDAGNVIPLSQRFNPQNDDIRYSISGTTRADAESEIESWPEVAYEGSIPNASSISSSLENWKEYGVRMVPSSLFSGGIASQYSAEGQSRVRSLMESMRTDGVQKPLIVVVDGSLDGLAYVLEGGHRIDAIKELGLKEFPALVVLDEDAFAERRYQISGAVGAEALGIRNLPDAEAMERSGASRLDIWRETGWWRGRDGEWRVEIPDFELSENLNGSKEDLAEERKLSDREFNLMLAIRDANKDFEDFHFRRVAERLNVPEADRASFDAETEKKEKAKRRGIERMIAEREKASRDLEALRSKKIVRALSEGRTVRLSDVIKPDSALANAFPELADIRIVAYSNLPYGVAGQFNGISIDISPALLRGDPEKFRSVLAHEVQHAIQAIEGFARGGSDELFTENVLDEDRIKDRMFSPELSNEEYAELQRQLAAIREGRGGQVFVSGRFFDSKHEAYRHLLGEAEARLVQKRLNMTPEERAARPPWEDYDVEEERMLVRYQIQPKTAPHGTQKQSSVEYPDAGAEISRFSIGARRREEYRSLLANRRPDLDAEAVLAELDKLGDPKKEKVALHWVVRGSLLLPQDAYKIDDALDVAAKAKVDPFAYKSPDELLLANKQFKPSARPIYPATVPELSDARDEGDGIVSYLVQDDRQGQAAMRRIIDTHWGEDANPWCLLARTKPGSGQLTYEDTARFIRSLSDEEKQRFESDGGTIGPVVVDGIKFDTDKIEDFFKKKQNPTLNDEAWGYWQHYSALPKRVAFKNGKLLAFMATHGLDLEDDWQAENDLQGRFPDLYAEYSEWLDTDEGQEEQASFTEWLEHNHDDAMEDAKENPDEQWWDRKDESHPDLDWARDASRYSVTPAEDATAQKARFSISSSDVTTFRSMDEAAAAAGEAYRASVAWNGPAYSYKSFATAYAARDRILGIDRPDDDYRRLLETMGVRDYSVDDLKADAEKIRARGLGRNEATLQRLAGLAEQESMARTVESLMRGSLELGEDVGSSARRAYETYLARMRRTAKGRDYTDLTADLGFDLADLALAIDPEAFAPQPKPEGDATPPAAGSDPEVAALLDGKAADFGLTEEQLRERIQERMEQRTQEIRERLERIRARLDEWRAKEALRKAKLAERQEAEGKSDAPADVPDAEMFDAEQNETEAGAKRLADYESECVEEMPDFKAFLEECRRDGLDLSDAAEFVAAVRIWSEDFIARETGADPENVLRDPVNLARYRATMMEFLHGMADEMLDPEDGAAAKTAERMMQEIPSDATVGEIDGRARTIVGFIQRNGIRQTRKQLIRELRKGIKLEAIRGKKWDEMERDAGRKVTGEREAAARYLYRILTWSDGMIAKESARLHDIVAGREDAYRSAGADDAALKDLARTDREVHRAAEKLQALQMYGGLRKKSPAEIKLAARAIMSWLTEEREAHEKRWNDWHARLDALAQRAAKAASASAQDYTPEDPGYVGKLADELTATIRQRLEQLFVGGGADARAVIDEVMRLVYTGSERMRAETAAARRRTDEMLERCVQGTGRNVRQFLKDLDAPIPDELNRQLRTAEQPVRMTNGQALQLLASLEQVASYAGNIEANGRGAERVVGTDQDGNPITEPQTPHAELLRRYFADKPAMVRLLEGMREVYEERRGALSDTFRAVTGNPILAPDPLYAPVKMFRGSSEGFETQVRAWDPFGPALQPRVKNTLDFDLSASIMDVYNNRTRETCRAIAWGIPGMELRSVLCRKEVQDAIARTHGKFPLRQLVAHLTDLVSDGWADEPSGFKWLAQKLGGATTYSALSWNVVTALKQTASIPAWTALMDGGYAEVFRNIANFDRAAARELMDAPGFAARYGADSFAQMFKDAIRDPNANPLQRFFQAGMTAVQMGDFVPGILVGTGVYKAKKLALMRQGLEERQAREEAARIAWGLIEECQQSSRLENSPAFLRRGGFLARQAAKFASSPLLQVSHEVHTLRMWAAEAKAEARRNGGGVRMMSDSEDVARWRRRFVNQLICNHVLMPVAFYGIATMFNIALGSEPPDEEEVLGDLAMQTIVGPFGRIFLLGMIFDKGGEAVARAMGGKPNVYDSTGLAAQQYIQKIVGQLGRIGGDVADADWESVRDDLLKMLGQVSAPARYAVKIGQNAAGYDPAEARRERKAEIRRERGE